MNSLLIFLALAVCAVTALPASDDLHNSAYTNYEAEIEDEFQRYRRSSPDREFEDVQFREDLLRHPRTLSEADLEEVTLGDLRNRLKRSTCDELHKWVSPPNHAACAVHCISRGYKCGRYVKNVCKCRN